MDLQRDQSPRSNKFFPDINQRAACPGRLLLLADGKQSVLVSNVFGTAGSSATLAVMPTIITSPLKNQSAFPGGTAVFTLGLQAVIPVSYQWQFNGININYATNNPLTLSNIGYAQAGVY